jgi:hypothetical protein
VGRGFCGLGTCVWAHAGWVERFVLCTDFENGC